VSSHTPAPWHADEHMVVRAANGDLICDVDPFDTFEDKARANLALIAAAPELLHALKLLAADVGQYEAWERPCAALDLAHAALAKAEAA
jgi:hypothetical protein